MIDHSYLKNEVLVGLEGQRSEVRRGARLLRALPRAAGGKRGRGAIPVTYGRAAPRLTRTPPTRFGAICGGRLDAIARQQRA